jgi:O-antigen ligase
MVYLLNNPSEIPKSNTSENFRVAAIIASFKIIEKRPINGTGPFAWNSYIKQNKPIFDVFPPESLKHTHCHNDFLQILAEFGIFFFIGFIFLIFSSIKSIFIKIKNEYSFNYIIILTIFLILLLGGLTDFLFGHPIVGSYYGFFLGIFTSLNKKQEFNS